MELGLWTRRAYAEEEDENEDEEDSQILGFCRGPSTLKERLNYSHAHLASSLLLEPDAVAAGNEWTDTVMILTRLPLGSTPWQQKGNNG